MRCCNELHLLFYYFVMRRFVCKNWTESLKGGTQKVGVKVAIVVTSERERECMCTVYVWKIGSEIYRMQKVAVLYFVSFLWHLQPRTLPWCSYLKAYTVPSTFIRFSSPSSAPYGLSNRCHITHTHTHDNNTRYTQYYYIHQTDDVEIAIKSFIIQRLLHQFEW